MPRTPRRSAPACTVPMSNCNPRTGHPDSARRTIGRSLSPLLHFGLLGRRSPRSPPGARRKFWNHPAFFDYVDRWMTEDDTQAVAEIKAQTGYDYSADWERQGQTHTGSTAKFPNHLHRRHVERLPLVNARLFTRGFSSTGNSIQCGLACRTTSIHYIHSNIEGTRRAT